MKDRSLLKLSIDIRRCLLKFRRPRFSWTNRSQHNRCWTIGGLFFTFTAESRQQHFGWGAQPQAKSNLMTLQEDYISSRHIWRYDEIPSCPDGRRQYDGKIRDIPLGKFGITRIITMYRSTIILIVTTLTLAWSRSVMGVITLKNFVTPGVSVMRDLAWLIESHVTDEWPLWLPLEDFKNLFYVTNFSLQDLNLSLKFVSNGQKSFFWCDDMKTHGTAWWHNFKSSRGQSRKYWNHT